MLRRIALVTAVLLASLFAGGVAVLMGMSGGVVCADAVSSQAGSGCVRSGGRMEWGVTQLVVFAAIGVSLFGLAVHLARGSRWGLVASVALAVGFVAIPAAATAPRAFNDSGPVQLPAFGR
jgi:hypothetical protein